VPFCIVLSPKSCKKRVLWHIFEVKKCIFYVFKCNFGAKMCFFEAFLTGKMANFGLFGAGNVFEMA